MFSSSVKILLQQDMPPSYSEVILDPVKFPSYLPSRTPPPPPYSLVKDKPFTRALDMITPEQGIDEIRRNSDSNTTSVPALLAMVGLAGFVLPQVAIGILDLHCQNNPTPTWLVISGIIWSIILITGNMLTIIADFNYFSEFFVFSNIVLFFLWIYGCSCIYQTSILQLDGKCCHCPLSFYLSWAYILIQGLCYGAGVAGLIVLGSAQASTLSVS